MFKLWMVFLCCFSSATYAQNDSSIRSSLLADLKTYESLNIPTINKVVNKKVIKIAVIDCGFNLEHRCIKNYIYKTPDEINGNDKDDDLNGYIDDLNGWDVADQDNNVSIPKGRESFFYHGTMIAGAIAQVAERCFGAHASELIKIIPVKAMGDQSNKPYMESGYEGIQYAIQSHADIIVCAWSGGKYEKDKYGQFFQEAKKRGILILSASGNFYSEQCDPPSSISSVYVVSAVDSTLHKLKASNYGRKVDLSAPGEFVYAPHPSKENTYGYNDGTSAAVSLIGGCAAILKVLKPEATPEEIMRALKNTAIPIDSLNIRYSGKLGAGFPDVNKAVNYLMSNSLKDTFFNSSRLEGDIMIEKSSSRNAWDIVSKGGIEGYYFTLKGEWKDQKTPIQFFSGDSLIASYSPVDFPAMTFIKAGTVRVQYKGKREKVPAMITYEASPVDSSKLYCSGIRNFDNPEGEFADGSGDANYTNDCDCKWQISVPEGKRVKITFDDFKTQAKIDYVSLYEGEYTIPENLLASFSGPALPPVIVSYSNKVLIWFISDSNTSDAGWHLNYSVTDEEPGVKPPLKK